jgi:hypothetical protein
VIYHCGILLINTDRQEKKMIASDLMSRIERLFPDFREFWESDDNYFRHEDGSYTCCGVYARFAQYFEIDCQDWGPVALDDVATLLEDCLMFPDSDSGTAAATCFLENIVGEPAEHALSDYFGPGSRKFLNVWKTHGHT